MAAQGKQTAETAGEAAVASYEIIRDGDSWTILHDGRKLGTLDTRMAAFDNVVSAVRSSIINGSEIAIKLERESTYPT